MKKNFYWNAVLLTAVIILSCFIPSVSAEKKVSAESGSGSFEVQQVRFANMLNHNFVYDSDFDSEEAIVNNAMLSMLDLSDDGEFISQQYVEGFVEDMYGVRITDKQSINADFPQKDGYYYIIPRGFATYDHEIIKVSQNEDGSFLVESDVTVCAHDDEPITLTAKSLFVKNENSAFGYNIISCDLY